MLLAVVVMYVSARGHLGQLSGSGETRAAFIASETHASEFGGRAGSVAGASPLKQPTRTPYSRTSGCLCEPGGTHRMPASAVTLPA